MGSLLCSLPDYIFMSKLEGSELKSTILGLCDYVQHTNDICTGKLNKDIVHIVKKFNEAYPIMQFSAGSEKDNYLSFLYFLTGEVQMGKSKGVSLEKLHGMRCAQTSKVSYRKENLTGYLIRRKRLICFHDKLNAEL